MIFIIAFFATCALESPATSSAAQCGSKVRHSVESGSEYSTVPDTSGTRLNHPLRRKDGDLKTTRDVRVTQNNISRPASTTATSKFRPRSLQWWGIGDARVRLRRSKCWCLHVDSRRERGNQVYIINKQNMLRAFHLCSHGSRSLVP